MTCTDPISVVLNRTKVPGVPNPSPHYELLVDINGHPQKAPKGWKIPACYFDLASIANAVGTLTVTTTGNTATFTSVVSGTTTTIDVPKLPASPAPLVAVAVQNQPPITTEYIGGGTVLLTEPAGWLPVTIGGVTYAMPLYSVVTP